MNNSRHGKGSSEKTMLLDSFVTPYHLVQAWEEYESAVEEAIMKPADLTLSQAFVLWVLLFTDKLMTATQLSALARREPHSMVQLLDKLQERKLVRRRRSRGDRRQVAVSLTDEGKQLISEILPAWQSSIRAIFQKSFSSEELKTLNEMLQRARDASISWRGTEISQAKTSAEQVVAFFRTEIKAMDPA
ncbi:MAG: MarR family winged helix-turn-helix transcriptional regulator, partial [Dehalococcoidia bacterium]